MFNFLKIQYLLGRITEEQLKALVGKKITQEQYKNICSQKVNNG
jgi:hypothetical protein